MLQDKTTTRTPTQLTLKIEKSPSSDHKELMDKIQKDKEEFLAKKKKEEDEKKQKELEKLISATKQPGKVDIGKTISDGEPSDPITKKRRNFVKKVTRHCRFILILNKFFICVKLSKNP